MRPPLQSAALQQNEVHASIRHTNNHHHSSIQPQLVPLPAKNSIIPLSRDLASKHTSKLQQRDLLVENHLNYACGGTAANTALKTTPLAYQQDPQEDDSIQLVDLSTSPTSLGNLSPSYLALQNLDFPPQQRHSIVSSDYQFSSSHSSSLSDDERDYSASQNELSRAHNFDDAAEKFIINFPGDSLQQETVHDCVSSLPLSETEPLLTNIEATVANRQRSIRLNKNSASLIFTKKDIPKPSAKVNNNNSVNSLSSNEICFNQSSAWRLDPKRRHTTKHLPASYHLQQQQQYKQQRRSLQLNYNNNLVTTSTCAAANNNYCCGLSGGLLDCKDSSKGGAVLHKHHRPQPAAGIEGNSSNSTTAATRKQHSYSWYAPVYSALEEELEQDSRESSPIHNLANTKKQHNSSATTQLQRSHSIHHHRGGTLSNDNERISLLESRNQINIQPQLFAQGKYTTTTSVRNNSHISVPSSLSLHSSKDGSVQAEFGSGFASGKVTAAYDVEGAPLAGSLGLAGGPVGLPRRKRFENFLPFLKSLVGRTASNSSSNGSSLDAASSSSTTTTTTNMSTTATKSIRNTPASPEITITRSPSDENMVVMRDPAGRRDVQQHKLMNGSNSSLNVVQQKIWNIMRREGSAASLYHEKSHSIVQYKSGGNGMRKCETVLALTQPPSSPLCSPVLSSAISGNLVNSRGSGIFSASGVEQIRPLNRLRYSATSINAGMTCSRCSSLLSLAASGSRYSLNVSSVNGGAAFGLSTSASQHQLQIPFRIRSRSNCTEDDVVPHRLGYNLRNSQSSGNCSRQSSSGAQSNTSSSCLSPPSATPRNISLHQTSPPTVNVPLTNSTLQLPPPQLNRHSLFNSNSSSSGLATHSKQSSSEAFSSEPSRDVLDVSCSKAVSTCPSTSSSASIGQMSQQQLPAAKVIFQTFTCKLCLLEVESASEATNLQCGCQFCTECMRAYVEFEISEGAYEISCPDAQCPAQGIITLSEIANLTTANLMKKHHRYRLNREIELDKSRTWCPRAGCETVCLVGQGIETEASTSAAVSSTPTQLGTDSNAAFLCAVLCPSCKDKFCSACKKTWHPNMTCEENSRRLVADGQDDIGIPFDNDLIKCCPMCAVPIEKDEGCAQMMCKRCKHVFCWYCLASLDDDFLLRHYDKGPCKNKLGHSRASVVWHRAQVIGIFAGFGILLLVASPLLLLAAPCIICCKCRSCSGSKIDEGDGDMDEAQALQS